MRSHRQKELKEYYDERAPEYDEIYLGKTPGIPEPHVYHKDVQAIKEICGNFGRGHLIDVGCGTGYWLPYYAQHCSEITLLDQARNMLVECQRRIKVLSTDAAVHFIKGNFFDVHFLKQIYDSAVCAFLVSHLGDEDEQVFWRKLMRILRPKAEVLWVDGSWSQTRKKYRVKEGFQNRNLNDGRSFAIYKKYYDKDDIESVVKMYSFKLRSLYLGEVFFAAHIELPI